MVSLRLVSSVGGLLSIFFIVALTVLAIVFGREEDWLIGPYAACGALALVFTIWPMSLCARVSPQLDLIAVELDRLAIDPRDTVTPGEKSATDEVLGLSGALLRVADVVLLYRSYVPQTTVGAIAEEAQALCGEDGRRYSSRQSGGVALDGDTEGDDEDTDTEDMDEEEATPAAAAAPEKTDSQAEQQSESRPGLVKSMSKFFRRESTEARKMADRQRRQSRAYSSNSDPPTRAVAHAPKWRNVALMCCNMRGLLTYLRDQQDPALDGHRRFVAAVLTAAKESKGCVDTFAGDRVNATWNAAVPVPTFRKNCCNGALLFANDLQSQREAAAFGSSVGIEVHPHIGITSGRCMIGEQGVPEMRRYTVFGEAVLHGVLLCAACRHYDEFMLADGSIKTDCDMHFVFKCRARLSFLKTAQVLDVSCLMRKRGVQTKKARAEADAKDEEWMYRVDGAESSDPVTLLNQSWEAWLEGEPGKARELMEKSALPPHQKDWMKVHLDTDPDGGKDHKEVLDPNRVL
eukprot:TRINITY_DN13508_c0_g1_i1.p1 TRINITY_DN13508_c0_g1~~TRINITY_DN13508_c0_g1_i1.p1  ORF type:complete len:578 (+),score=189.31 TRINITY_DN13508_c0_g1_i1:182-1735(+)